MNQAESPRPDPSLPAAEKNPPRTEHPSPPTSAVRIPLDRSETRILLAFAISGLLLPNGLFLYFAITHPQNLWEALKNPVSLAFLIEAGMLTGMFAWLLHRKSGGRVGSVLFVTLSLIGSLAFSIPATLIRLRHRND